MVFKHSWEYEAQRRKNRIRAFLTTVGILTSTFAIVYALIMLFHSFFRFVG